MSKRSAEAVKSLKALKKNWNSYGAKPFRKKFCDTVEVCLWQIEDVIGDAWEIEVDCSGKQVAIIIKDEE
jgi:hypothetical protein